MSELIEKLEALEKQSQKLYEESRAHMKKWQGDREIIMRLVLGYEYKNRVDDPEWEKALSILRALIASAATPPGDGGLREAAVAFIGKAREHGAVSPNGIFGKEIMVLAAALDPRKEGEG